MTEFITQSLTIDSALADWTRVLDFGQFDPSLGTLDSVTFTIYAAGWGNIAIENLGAAAADVSVAITNNFWVQAAGLTVVSMSTNATRTDALAAFDGSIDYAGASGAKLLGIDNAGTASGSLTTNLSAFIGSGLMPLTVTDTGNAAVTGGGALRESLLTAASAIVNVTYAYTPVGQSGGGGFSGGSGFTLAENSVPGVLNIANAQTSVAQTLTIAPEVVGWTTSWAVSRFDPSLGRLEAIDITVNGTIIGTVSAENTGPAAITYNTTQSADVTLDLPGTTDATVGMTTQDSMALGAFDGTVDFAGSSGRIDTGSDPYPLAGQLTTSITDASVLAAFTGTGSYALPISSLGTSYATGGANMEVLQQLSTGAVVSLSYVYEAAAELPCFAAGTRILTTDGPVAVERLAPGQHAVTADGIALPIIWIGHRSVDCTHHPDPARILPVRVRRGAFGRGQPRRDLLLSPDHAVFFDGVLIPIRLLVNRHSIEQIAADRITYYHVELTRHAVLLADNLPVESFLDTGNRSAFANGGPGIQLYPDFAPMTWEAAGCAPLVVTGAPLQAARRHLARIEKQTERLAASRTATRTPNTPTATTPPGRAARPKRSPTRSTDPIKVRAR